jgi:predicted nuclease of restriction endonuclease-like (RecB) superfamily
MANEVKPIISLAADIKDLIEQSRQQVSLQVNVALSMLYWQIGQRINNEILHNKRAAYGKQVIRLLSQQLEVEVGKGWSEKQLRHCLRMVETFPDIQIISTVSRQLSWSHLKEIIYVDDELKRKFYIEICSLEKWSVRALRERINSMLYERTSISKNPEQTIRKELEGLEKHKKMSPDLIFRDPYLLDFMGLKDTYSEKDLESAIIAELQQFIIELGNDFAFMARQKRIQIDNRDYYIDLLFFHRRLKRLIAIDLKIGEFEAGFKGQMELYLNYLEKHEKIDDENSPIGLILCTGKNEEHIELMQLEKSNIKVAEYYTILPPKNVLKQKLHHAIEMAKNKIDAK